ncbi:Uncharacterised protein [uncultured archaeon]|nr:Uncharacterised protein [uncultured archaeon]
MAEKSGQEYNLLDEIMKILEEGYKEKINPNQLEIKVAETPIVKKGIGGFFDRLRKYFNERKLVDRGNLITYGYLSPETLKILNDSDD